VKLVDDATADQARDRAVGEALRALESGQSVVLYSAHGPDDAAIAATRTHLKALGIDPNTAGQRLASQQGRILREILKQNRHIRRVCVAGGDTCSHAARHLDIIALEMITPLVPGGPLCRASTRDPRLDGLEIVLKGGQVGEEDYYGLILRGRG